MNIILRISSSRGGVSALELIYYLSMEESFAPIKVKTLITLQYTYYTNIHCPLSRYMKPHDNYLNATNIDFTDWMLLPLVAVLTML